MTEIAAMPAWPGAGERRVRVYCRGPSAGVGPTTRVLVNLHGLGGRQADVSYKRVRRDLADRFDLIVLGVDVLGTDAYRVDQAHLAAEGRRLELAAGPVFAAAAKLAQAHGVDEVLSPDERLSFTVNAHARAQLALPRPTDFWDFGLIQATDVLRALAWLRSDLARLGLDPRRPVHLVSRSAGSQIALLCLRLAPHVFASLLDVGGSYFPGSRRDALRALLTSPLGHIPSRDYSCVRIGARPAIICLRAAPVGFRADDPAVDDEVAARDVSTIPWDLPRGLPVRSLAGARDARMDSAARRETHAALAAGGAACELREIDDGDVDGVAFADAEHDLVADLAAVVERCGSDLLAAPASAGDDPLVERELRCGEAAWRSAVGGIVRVVG